MGRQLLKSWFCLSLLVSFLSSCKPNQDLELSPEVPLQISSDMHYLCWEPAYEEDSENIDFQVCYDSPVQIPVSAPMIVTQYLKTKSEISSLPNYVIIHNQSSGCEVPGLCKQIAGTEENMYLCWDEPASKNTPVLKCINDPQNILIPTEEYEMPQPLLDLFFLPEDLESIDIEVQFVK